MYRLLCVRPCFLVFVVLFAGVSLGQEDRPEIDPSGTWKWKRSYGPVRVGYTLRLQLKDGKLGGTYAFRSENTDQFVGEPVAIDEAMLAGNELTFKVTIQHGQRLRGSYRGTVDGDAIQGSIEVNSRGNTRRLDWTAKRVVELADVVATWHLTIHNSDGELIESTLKLSQAGEQTMGEYISQRLGPTEVQEIRLHDNQLSYQVTFTRDGNSITGTYVGQPRGDRMKGRLRIELDGQTRELDFEARLRSE